MMSRDGARTAQPARPEEPPTVFRENANGGQDTGRQGERRRSDRVAIISSRNGWWKPIGRRR
jgi:hypothetical protein